MANRRMLSKSITNSAKFIKMPTETQALYFHLCIWADDDWVCEAYSIMRLLWSTEDSIRILHSKWFVRILNEDLVTYIIDRNEHNLLRADRKVNSIYKDLLLQVIPDVQLLEPKHRADRPILKNGTSQGQPMDGLGEGSIGEDRVGKDKIVKEWFEEFWKLFPHARPSKKPDAKKFYNECLNTYDEIFKEVKYMKWCIEFNLMDWWFVKWCALWIRDFIPTDENIKKQNIKKIVYTLMQNKEKDPETAKKLINDFGNEIIDKYVKEYNKEFNTPILK